MALQQLADVPAALAWLQARGACGLVTDSRRVRLADAFIAWPGAATDGRRHVPQALAAGAVACLVEAEGADGVGLPDDAGIAALSQLKARAGDIASRHFENPSSRIEVVAVTGTNGKSSTAWWTAQALTALGRRCGFVGTLGAGDPPLQGRPATVVSTGLTTPDPVALQFVFKRFADTGYAACAIEASSIGIAEDRLAGTRIAVALYTNLTLDHLDYHGSMERYAEAKDRLFAWPGLRAAVVNLDDAHGAQLAATLAAGPLDLWTYAVGGDARLAAEAVSYADGGLAFTLTEGATAVEVRTRLIGSYNVSNLLAAIGGLRALGVPLADAAAVCSVLTPVPGRMQRVAAELPGAPEVIVDYAHTPDALEKALSALRPLAQARGGRLWCVFGCGGNRDAVKRPLMGAIAERLADRVVVTSDNPRLEDPVAILRDIAKAIGAGATLLEDRRAAITHALVEAGPHDVVLIAGKGHEDYQDAGGVRLPFDDAQVATVALQARGAAA